MAMMIIQVEDKDINLDFSSGYLHGDIIMLCPLSLIPIGRVYIICASLR